METVDLSVLLTYNLLPWQWAVWICFGLAIGMTKAGFSGLSAAVIPLIALIFGARTSTGINLPLLFFADILAVCYYRSHTNWKYIFKLLPWTLAGYAAALVVYRVVPVQSFRYLMGACILAGLFIMIWNDRRGKDKPVPSAWWFPAVFGTAGGFAAIIGNIGGPIMAIYLLAMRIPKNSYICTTAWYFLITNALKFPVQIFLWKNITVQTLLFNLTNIPAITIGAVLGVLLIRRIHQPSYRKVIMLLTLISTLLLFVDFGRI